MRCTFCGHTLRGCAALNNELVDLEAPNAAGEVLC